MDTRKEFLKIMREQTEIGLATSVDGQPNVRIVNFYYDEGKNILYFSSFPDNEKTAEFPHNNKIAVTTIPHNGIAHVKAKGLVAESNLGILDLKTEFVNKIDGYDSTIEAAGEFLKLYEIKFREATVTLDFEHTDMLII